MKVETTHPDRDVVTIFVEPDDATSCIGHATTCIIAYRRSTSWTVVVSTMLHGQLGWVNSSADGVSTGSLGERVTALVLECVGSADGEFDGQSVATAAAEALTLAARSMT